MPVAIAGMHRSGTSMVTRLLNLCGLYLGKQEDFLPATKDNPEGFWENAKFQSINDEILMSLNGGWDIPPTIEAGWEASSHLADLSENASALIKGFPQQLMWGWKDPRNSLTLPFWKKLIPNLKIIVCVRNPFEVYRSLARRGTASSVFSYNLWFIYNQRLIASTKPEERLFTHYESFFHNPQSELRRLLNFLELKASDEVINTACQTISTSLRHNRGSVDDLYETKAPDKVLDLYRKLSLRAGRIDGISLSLDNDIFLQTLPTEEFAITRFNKDVQRIRYNLKIASEENLRMQQEIAKLEDDKKVLQSDINNILTSRSWRVIQIFQKIKVFFYSHW